MKSLLFFLLCGTLFCSCTANAQTAINKPATIESPASCMTAAPVCTLNDLASNIKMNESSFVATFENHTIIYGRTWNCFAVYEGDELVYFGDGEAFWLDGNTYCMEGGTFKATVSLSSGAGTLEESGEPSMELRRPAYNGKCSRSDWSITQRAN